MELDIWSDDNLVRILGDEIRTFFSSDKWIEGGFP